MGKERKVMTLWGVGTGPEYLLDFAAESAFGNLVYRQSWDIPPTPISYFAVGQFNA